MVAAKTSLTKECSRHWSVVPRSRKPVVVVQRCRRDSYPDTAWDHAQQGCRALSDVVIPERFPDLVSVYVHVVLHSVPL